VETDGVRRRGDYAQTGGLREGVETVEREDWIAQSSKTMENSSEKWSSISGGTSIRVVTGENYLRCRIRGRRSC